MKKRKLVRWLSIPVAGVAALSLLTIVGCVRTSGGTWYFKSAELPEGWPELTPIGQVQVKQYPEYRAAMVTEEAADGGTGPMFNSLFSHIKSNDIAMTAPVDMTYSDSDKPKMTAMAFLYRTKDLGPVGQDGVVRIDDVDERTYASVGVRGSYSRSNFKRGLAKVETWLDNQTEWQADGPPRFLGYNGPFVPYFWRYGEVQLPITSSAKPPDSK